MHNDFRIPTKQAYATQSGIASSWEDFLAHGRTSFSSNSMNGSGLNPGASKSISIYGTTYTRTRIFLELVSDNNYIQDFLLGFKVIQNGDYLTHNPINIYLVNSWPSSYSAAMSFTPNAELPEYEATLFSFITDITSDRLTVDFDGFYFYEFTTSIENTSRTPIYIMLDRNIEDGMYLEEPLETTENLYPDALFTRYQGYDFDEIVIPWWYVPYYTPPITMLGSCSCGPTYRNLIHIPRRRVRK
jgi:hypothetical protein